uniref:Uncharacterized protein n=1 Tax=Candidatus Kentrum sp. MB TaxID=2138164 RepID=A0A450XK17_9GAMM|nr:MAG: hypothetical protein BECKMB1821G_GA0114241_10156 [Candidatus Kentron sp. MB]VFK29627.1 MAG: hypothetical protein BECKMB1821I_GA0114274_10115 [Candidatus Kentron sp. MB]VFK74842.1 MAG: hypothetical protein BECKMB1821H_GA0114242_10115 [Candidatus Kentron sp. MB]
MMLVAMSTAISLCARVAKSILNRRCEERDAWFLSRQLAVRARRGEGGFIVMALATYREPRRAQQLLINGQVFNGYVLTYVCIALAALPGTATPIQIQSMEYHGRLAAKYENLKERSAVVLGPPPGTLYSGLRTEMLGNLEVAISGAKARASVYYEGTRDGQLELTELFIDAGVDENAFVLVGRKREVWGNGITWNPANLLGEPLFDPETWRTRPLDGVPGREMFQVGTAMPAGEFTLYALPGLVDPGGNKETGLDLAARATFLFDELETNIGAVQTVNGKNRRSRRSALAFWFSAPLGSQTTLFGDASAHFHNPFLYPSDTTLDLDAGRAGETVGSFLLGLRYRLPSDTLLRMEYFRNGFGYSDGQREALFEGLASAFATLDLTNFERFASNYTRFLLSKNWVSFSAVHQAISPKWDWRAGVTLGIDDGSYSPSFSVSYQLTRSIELRVDGLLDRGPDTAEFRQQAIENRFTGGVVWHF